MGSWDAMSSLFVLAWASAEGCFVSSGLWQPCSIDLFMHCMMNLGIVAGKVHSAAGEGRAAAC